MAQLSGVMTADFSDFHFEIDKSVTKLKELEGASTHTSGAVGEFSEGLSTVDKTLGLFGIRIGPQIQALREFSGVLGKSTSEMSNWGVAASAMGAFAAGWQIGTWIDEWTGLSKAIADTTATAMGWDDVAQRTGARLDVLARATQIAGREITNFDQAMQIIKKHNAEVAESFNTGAARVEQWNRELAKVAKDMPTIQAELKNHTSTVQQLAQHYGISTQALEYYNRTLADSSKAQKAWADEARPKYEALARAQEEINNAGLGWQKTVAAIAPATAALVQHYLNLDVSVASLALKYGLTTTEVKALDTQMKYNLATMAATEPALGTLDQWIKTNVADTKAWNTEWRFTSEVIDTQVIPSLDAVAAKAQTVAATVAAVTGASVAPGMDQKAPGASIPIDLGNISYGTMGFAKVFEEYTKKNTGGGALGGFIGGGPPKDFLTWALSMGLATRGPTVTNTFNIVDTESGIARRVGDTITSQIQKGSLVN